MNMEADVDLMTSLRILGEGDLYPNCSTNIWARPPLLLADEGHPRGPHPERDNGLPPHRKSLSHDMTAQLAHIFTYPPHHWIFHCNPSHITVLRPAVALSNAFVISNRAFLSVHCAAVLFNSMLSSLTAYRARLTLFLGPYSSCDRDDANSDHRSQPPETRMLSTTKSLYRSVLSGSSVTGTSSNKASTRKAHCPCNDKVGLVVGAVVGDLVGYIVGCLEG
jgi:hypothetical protein